MSVLHLLIAHLRVVHDIFWCCRLPRLVHDRQANCHPASAHRCSYYLCSLCCLLIRCTSTGYIDISNALQAHSVFQLIVTLIANEMYRKIVMFRSEVLLHLRACTCTVHVHVHVDIPSTCSYVHVDLTAYVRALAHHACTWSFHCTRAPIIAFI